MWLLRVARCALCVACCAFVVVGYDVVVVPSCLTRDVFL